MNLPYFLQLCSPFLCSPGWLHCGAGCECQCQQLIASMQVLCQEEYDIYVDDCLFLTLGSTLYNFYTFINNIYTFFLLPSLDHSSSLHLNLLYMVSLQIRDHFFELFVKPKISFIKLQFSKSLSILQRFAAVSSPVPGIQS